MIVERTHYYARPGFVGEVLRARQSACAIRRSLGLTIGTIRVKIEGDGPDVSWECSFPTVAHHKADLATRDQSAEFASVRRRMEDLLVRFERIVEESTMSIEDHWGRDWALDGVAIQPEAIEFRSAGNHLVGYLYRPPGEGPFPCMITNHGSGIGKGTTDICRPAGGALLMSWGISSFLPHRRGYGDSSGPAWQDEVTAEKGTDQWADQLASRLDRESEDIIEALRTVSARNDIDAGHVGVMGSSFGGTTSLLAAAKSEQFQCTVDFAGAAMTWDEAGKLRELMFRAADELTHPIMFVQASTDYSTAPTRELSQHLARTPLAVESKVFPAWGLTRDEGHLFESRGMQVWGPDVRRFLERWL